MLQAGGFSVLPGGGYQQPHFPFGSALLTAPEGFEFPPGFPFADGGVGLDPLRRRLTDTETEQVLRRGLSGGSNPVNPASQVGILSTVSSGRFRVQTTDTAVRDSVQGLFGQVSAMMMKMQMNTALNMQMFHPTDPLTMNEVQTLQTSVNGANPVVGTPLLRFSGPTTTTSTTSTSTTLTTTTTTVTSGPTAAPSTTFYELEMPIALPLNSVDLNALSELAAGKLGNAIAEGLAKTACMSVAANFGSAAECQVGQDSTTASSVIRATMTFDFDAQLLQAGGFAALGGGEFQVPLNFSPVRRTSVKFRVGGSASRPSFFTIVHEVVYPDCQCRHTSTHSIGTRICGQHDAHLTKMVSPHNYTGLVDQSVKFRVGGCDLCGRSLADVSANTRIVDRSLSNRISLMGVRS